MAFLAGVCRRRSSLLTSLHSHLFPEQLICRSRWFSTTADSPQSDFVGLNAYDLLEVTQTSSFSDIKASFRKLAKETHPDLARSKNDPAASRRFVRILAAYEILSDSDKRAHYDRYLLSQKRSLQKAPGQGSPYYWRQESHITMTNQMEVVEWLSWYRYAIKEILSEKHVVAGSGYFDALEGEFYSAIHAAYYGPHIESMDLLPDCFEAEERSFYGTPEVLHLVSGRNLFGYVHIVDEIPKLSHGCSKKLISFASTGSTICRSVENMDIHVNLDAMDGGDNSHMQGEKCMHCKSDAYKDLELHICGKVVAVATRVPPRSYCDGIRNEDSEDHIHVFISSDEDTVFNSEVYKYSILGDSVGQRIPLGTITGLGTNPEEGSCTVYNCNGAKTHVIMKHRTLLVKHLHWYRVGDEVSVCECRCSRARLPPSKFWLFEPRCGMHDIGGWYVEMFGRDKTGQTVTSGRYWDGFDLGEEHEKRLHPAMYLLTLAYRTLDLEVARRQKRTVKDIAAGIFTWCKKLV